MTDETMPSSPEEVRERLHRLGMKALEAFHAVVEEGGFSRAAEKLHLSQPTVSQHVQRIEEVLGAPLFVRRGDPLELTDLGRVCYEKLRSVQAAREDLREALLEFYQVERTSLDLGASTIPGEFILPDVLSGFSREHPDLTVELSIADSSEIFERVSRGQLRAGVVGSKREDDSVQCTPLLEDEMILVGSAERFERDQPLNETQLSDLPYVARKSGSGTQMAVEDHFRQAGYDPDRLLQPVARMDTVQAVRESVLGGLGISYLPWIAVDRDLRSDRLVRLQFEVPRIARSFCWIENRFLGLSTLLNRFKKYLDDRWSQRKSNHG